jgi:hypothetical protein
MFKIKFKLSEAQEARLKNSLIYLSKTRYLFWITFILNLWIEFFFLEESDEDSFL